MLFGLGDKVQADGARRTPGRAIYVDHGLTGTHRDRPGLRLALAASQSQTTDPIGRPLFNVLVMVAKFESDLIRLRTREGMKVGKAKGRLRGKQPKLKPNQAKHLLKLHDSGNCTPAELAELFGVGRSTIYRTIERMRAQTRRT